MSRGSRSGGAGELGGRRRRGCVQKGLSNKPKETFSGREKKDCRLTEVESSRKRDTAQLLDPRVYEREKPPLCGDSGRRKFAFAHGGSPWWSGTQLHNHRISHFNKATGSETEKHVVDSINGISLTYNSWRPIEKCMREKVNLVPVLETFVLWIDS